MGNKKKINPFRLKELRSLKNLNQTELSKKSGVSVRTINKIENEKDLIEVQKYIFEKLRRVLQCSTAELSRKSSTKFETESLTNITLDASTFRNLKKVSDEYNVSIQEIINTAPLLFADFAEKCLEKESEDLAMGEDSYLDEKLNKHDTLKHINQYREKMAVLEEHSVDERDILRHAYPEFINQFRKAISCKDVLFKSFSSEDHLEKIIDENYLKIDEENEEDLQFIEYIFSLFDLYVPMNKQIIKLLNNRRMTELFDYDAGSEYLFGRANEKKFRGSLITFYTSN